MTDRLTVLVWFGLVSCVGVGGKLGGRRDEVRLFLFLFILLFILLESTLIYYRSQQVPRVKISRDKGRRLSKVQEAFTI